MIRNQYINGSYHKKLIKDYQKCLDPLEFEDKIQFTESLISYTKLQINLYETENEEILEDLSEFYMENFPKHFGRKITHVVLEIQFFSYFDPFYVFVQKELVPLEHLNNEMDPQGFTDEEFKIVLKRDLSIFQTQLEFLYLEKKIDPYIGNFGTLIDKSLQDFEYKILWLGTPKELTELFIELFRKGYIPSIPEVGIIQQLFDNSSGIEQYLAPAARFDAREDIFNHLFVDSYRPRFDIIRPTNEKKKFVFEDLQHKIFWIGIQKELAELFIELFRKGYIPEVPKAKVIQQLFDNSKSIGQYLKKATDLKSNVDTYEQLYVDGYRPRFDSIRPTTKK